MVIWNRNGASSVNIDVEDESSMQTYEEEKTRPGGVNGPHCFSLRGSNMASPGREKTPRTLAHAREGQPLRRAQRGDFFYPWAEICST